MKNSHVVINNISGLSVRSSEDYFNPNHLVMKGTEEECWEFFNNQAEDFDEVYEPNDPDEGHYNYLSESNQLKSFDIQ